MRLCVCAGAVLIGTSALAWAQSPGPARVGTILAEPRPITRSQEFVGRIEAVDRVDVRARVTGYLQAVLFKEGDVVKEGAELFLIEQEPFQAAVQEALGALYRAQADYANATLQAQRAEELVKSNATPVSERDRRVAEQKKTQGDVITADADLKTAQINLAYTEIAAPITGMVGRSRVTKGNVVGPDSGILTTIVSQDPMYVVFPVSQREFLRLEGEREKLGDRLVVQIAFSDGRIYDSVGKIDFIDVMVDRATDSVTVRASLPNPRDRLIDGQLVRVLVQGDKPDMKISIPQSALIADQQGIYVFVIADGKAAIRRIQTAGEDGGNTIIEAGLKAGDQVITEGMEGLREGAAVTATPAAAPPDRS
jgi:membrane fusion protein (multidrug efflux system)